MRSWTASYVKKNLWKVASARGDFDDLMQDCWIVFHRCRTKYSGIVDNPAWFMSLYKRAIACEFIDMAKDATNNRHEIVMSNVGALNEDGTTSFDLGEVVGELSNEGEMRVMIRQAPSEVRAVLAIMLNAPLEVLEMLQEAFKTGACSKVNRRLCMFIGIEEETDLLGRVRDYFG